ncbi:hypothetical protein HNO89_000133 [Sporosarcina luteola]|nr:hypothetical protein [Sporosarcina luteola]
MLPIVLLNQSMALLSMNAVLSVLSKWLILHAFRQGKRLNLA